MEWITVIKKTLNYIENNILDIKSIDEVANSVYISPMYLQKGFQVIVGYSIGEYIRNRKLYLAAKDLESTKYKVIDIAYKYGYETPESFTKAFTKFHGINPKDVKNNPSLINEFPRLSIEYIVKGVKEMNVKIVNMFPIKLIGFEKVFDYETSHTEIPKFWDEICEKHCQRIYSGLDPVTEYEHAIVDNCIGEYGVCIDDLGDNKFRYLVAGKYCGGNVPEGMVIYEFSSKLWAVFDSIGPNPKTLQSINDQIFNDWLPNNDEYELDGCANIEWYDCINGNMSDDDYHSAIWIPITKK